MTRAPVIDTHAHVFFEELLGKAGAYGPEAGERDGRRYFRSGSFEIPGKHPWDGPMGALSARHALMDELGIDLQVVTGVPHVYYYRLDAATAIAFYREHNDLMAAYVDGSDRLLGAAMLPLQDPAASVRELERSVRELGLVASHLGADAGDRMLSDPVFEELWAAHEELGVPVMIHAGSTVDGPPPGALADWALETTLGFPAAAAYAGAHLILGGVLDRHPRLRVHLAHGGGFLPYQKGRLELSIERGGKVRLERPFNDSWSQLSFDTALHGRESLEFLIDVAGASNVLIGTNFGGWDQEDEIVELVRASPRSDADIAAILRGNALSLFPAFTTTT
ncbi:MAG TPA: amidohydrolase family protein [Baekduia sp.]|nr:amidohydrolase family protein [Baekduia sp.]